MSIFLNIFFTRIMSLQSLGLLAQMVSVPVVKIGFYFTSTDRGFFAGNMIVRFLLTKPSTLKRNLESSKYDGYFNMQSQEEAKAMLLRQKNHLRKRGDIARTNLSHGSWVLRWTYDHILNYATLQPTWQPLHHQLSTRPTAE